MVEDVNASVDATAPDATKDLEFVFVSLEDMEELAIKVYLIKKTVG